MLVFGEFFVGKMVPCGFSFLLPVFLGGRMGTAFLGGFASLISGVKNTQKKIEVESLGFEKTGGEKPGKNKTWCQQKL